MAFQKDMNNNNTFHEEYNITTDRIFREIHSNTSSSLRRTCQKFVIPRAGGRLRSCKMATSGEEKVFYTLQFHVSRSVLSVQREVRTRFNKEPPAKNFLRKWYDQF
jgi:hypothetical protein